jgi:diadenosine tetraphosphate (Ap4A) HIT family hydrolase
METVSHFHLHVVPRYVGDAVFLKFGHGNRAERLSELERITGGWSLQIGASALRHPDLLIL